MAMHSGRDISVFYFIETCDEDVFEFLTYDSDHMENTHFFVRRDYGHFNPAGSATL